MNFPRQIRLAASLALMFAMAAEWPRAAAGSPYLAQLNEGLDLLRRAMARQASDRLAGANCDDYVDPLGWIALGTAHLEQGQVDAALEDFERAAEFAAAGSPQARAAAPLADFGTAVCALQRGEPAAARERLGALVEQGFTAALQALAYADLACGDRASARRHAEAALEQFPDDPLALAVLGRTWVGTRAIAYLRQALEACPGSPYAAPLSALALPNRPRPARTRELMRIDLRGDGDNHAVVTWLGEGAPDYFLLKVDGSPAGMSNSPPHRFGLPRELGPGPHGVVVEAWGHGHMLGRAGVVLWSQAEGTPADRYPTSEYGAVQQGLGDALMPVPNRVHVHYWLASAYAASGARPAAATHYERVVALDPDFADARQRLVRLNAELGRKGATDVLYQGHRQWVYLTFDDGPTPVITPQILSMLREAKVRATFFLVGSQARTYPELVRQIAAEGHELAGHTYSHDDLTTKTPGQVQRELLLTQWIIEEAAGRRTRLYRPPGGRQTLAVREAAAQVGYRTVLWSASIGVAAGLPTERGLARLLADVKPGAIVLLHNGPDETVDILPGLLAALKRRGYQCATLSETLGQ